MTRIGLIDYGMGNLHSVQRALQRLDAEVQPVRCAADMVACDGLVLPGVGAFDPAMERLESGELAAAIRGWCENDGALRSPRVALHRADPVAFLNNPGDPYDVVLVDLLEPEGPRRLGDGVDVDDRSSRGVHGEPLLHAFAEVAAAAGIEHDLHGEGTIDGLGDD
jgi:hypothetical protein